MYVQWFRLVVAWPGSVLCFQNTMDMPVTSSRCRTVILKWSFSASVGANPAIPNTIPIADDMSATDSEATGWIFHLVASHHGHFRPDGTSSPSSNRTGMNVMVVCIVARAITNSRWMHVCRDILRIRACRFATIFLAQKFPPTTQIAEKNKQNGAAREINNSSPNEDIVGQLIT